ncbi:hypothetical protein OS493_035371 [Desmophyllum pertusum]|uniref:Uncharacterized protein n=1 Tax=Desmophyllum pertusum TaxID=174260 RepID=A0A9X0D8H9_9CNID|nr:hypothetical protein OS493_035371 [Desmophyllum pertusum]
MSPQATLFAFILVVCGLSPLTDAQDAIHCENLEYTGPIRENQRMFTTVLQIEIAQLRKYMDQSIEDIKVDYVRKAFWNKQRWNPELRATLRRNLRRRRGRNGAFAWRIYALCLSQQYHFFLPEGETPSAYEQTLPLFRMYGQLYVDTLLDQIAVAKTKGKESLAVKQAEALIAKVKEFTEHAKMAFNLIVRHHLTPHIMPTKDNPDCEVLPGTNVKMCVCTLSIGPGKFDEIDVKGGPKDKTKNWCVGITYNARDSCKTTVSCVCEKIP